MSRPIEADLPPIAGMLVEPVINPSLYYGRPIPDAHRLPQIGFANALLNVRRPPKISRSEP